MSRVQLIGWPCVEIDLVTGEAVSGPVAVKLGPVELVVLRALATGRPRRRAELEASLRTISDAPVDEAVARLIAGLGTYGNRVERVGRETWKLWDGPE